MRKILAGGGILMTLAASGCGGSGAHPSTGAKTSPPRMLDTSRVARSIVASILSQRHIHARVRCPHHVPLRQGWHFVCLATDRAGQTPFVVTEVDSRGSTTYVGK